MNRIRLIRRNSGALGSTLGALLPFATTAPVPALGSDWWTDPWRTSTDPLDSGCRRLVAEFKNEFDRIAADAEPEGVVFAEIEPSKDLPLTFWQAILHIPDRFADPRRRIVLKRVNDRGVAGIRVCAPDGQVIGMVEPEELFCLDYWSEWAAYWLLAANRVTPKMIRATLEKHLPL